MASAALNPSAQDGFQIFLSFFKPDAETGGYVARFRGPFRSIQSAKRSACRVRRRWPDAERLRVCIVAGDQAEHILQHRNRA